MSQITMWLRKGLLIAAALCLGLAWLPLVNVSAQGLSDPGTPTPSALGQISTDRLQKAWAREQQVYNRIGQLLDRADTIIPRIQNLIDRAKAHGKDVSDLQAALDAFAAAVKQIHPIYESGKGLIASHQGFDDSGNVTDPAKALETVQDMRDKLKEIRQTVGTTLKDLRNAIQAYRQANPIPTPAVSSQGG